MLYIKIIYNISKITKQLVFSFIPFYVYSDTETSDLGKNIEMFSPQCVLKMCGKLSKLMDCVYHLAMLGLEL